LEFDSLGRAGSPFVNEGRVVMSVAKLVEHFSALEYPRCAGKVEHRRIGILIIVASAMIACAERGTISRSTAAISWTGRSPS
jgi:hypothetical protein